MEIVSKLQGAEGEGSAFVTPLVKEFEEKVKVIVQETFLSRVPGSPNDKKTCKECARTFMSKGKGEAVGGLAVGLVISNEMCQGFFQKNLHEATHGWCKSKAQQFGGRLPANSEVDAILGGKAHKFGTGHDSWMPSMDEKWQPDWIQTGDPNRYCQSHREEHHHYPGWGDEEHEMRHRGWMFIIAFDPVAFALDFLKLDEAVVKSLGTAIGLCSDLRKKGLVKDGD